MRNLLRMIFYRIIENKFYLVLALGIPPIVVIAAIIFTNNIDNTIRVRSNRRRYSSYRRFSSYGFRGRTKVIRTSRR